MNMLGILTNTHAVYNKLFLCSENYRLVIYIIYNAMYSTIPHQS